MPISPERKALYPDDWPEISARIRERAGDRCEWCGVPNGATIYRDGTGWAVAGGEDGELMRVLGAHPVTIVLTVAHLDHNPRNCADGNLAALCQACHLRYDAKEHAVHAAETRRRKLEEAGQRRLL